MMKYLSIFALTLLISFSACGHKSTTNEETDLVVDSVEVVNDTTQNSGGGTTTDSPEVEEPTQEPPVK